MLPRWHSSLHLVQAKYSVHHLFRPTARLAGTVPSPLTLAQRYSTRLLSRVRGCASACSALSRCLEQEHGRLLFPLFSTRYVRFAVHSVFPHRKRRPPQRREPELYDNPARIDPCSDRYIHERCHQGDHSRHHKRRGGKKRCVRAGGVSCAIINQGIGQFSHSACTRMHDTLKLPGIKPHTFSNIATCKFPQDTLHASLQFMTTSHSLARRRNE